VISVFVRIVAVLQGRWRVRVLDATPEGKRHKLHENRDHPLIAARFQFMQKAVL